MSGPALTLGHFGLVVLGGAGVKRAHASSLRSNSGRKSTVHPRVDFICDPPAQSNFDPALALKGYGAAVFVLDALERRLEAAGVESTQRAYRFL